MELTRQGYKLFIFSFSVLLADSVHKADISLSNPKKNWVSFFKTMQEYTDIDTFVETGTYLGDTTAQAALCFSSVHTIELNTDFYTQAVERFKDDVNVIVHHGDSAAIFPGLLSQLAKQQKYPLFWLDGHYMTCMGDQSDAIEPSIDNEFTPIWLELSAIKNNLFKSVILIDDVRLFGTLLHNKRIERAGNKHYPLLADVCALLKSMDFSYVIIGDIICAYNKSVDLSFSPIINACTMSRLFDGTNYTIGKVLEAEKLIGQAGAEELLSLKELYEDFSMYWRGWANKSPHYNLWYGLILKHQGNYENACAQFKEVISLGYNHWRVYWYLAESLYQINKLGESQEALEKVFADNLDFQPAQLLLEKILNN